MSGHDDSTHTTQLPPPPVSADFDLRRFPNLLLNVQDLRDSDFAALASPAEFRAGILLMCAAWHQVPAGSLPTDDRLLAALVRLDLKTWIKVKSGALNGFTEHADGRLYQPVLTAMVIKSWASMQTQKQRTSAATAARKERHVQRDDERNDDRNVHQRKGKERNIDRTQPPPPSAVVVSGGGIFEKEIGLGDMLADVVGFDDQALLDSLTEAAAGASGEQLERAAAVIKCGGTAIRDRAAWAIKIARLAHAGLVTSLPEPAAAIEQPAIEHPARAWQGKEGWRINTENFGELRVESNGMLRSAAGILHPAAARAIAARVKAGEITLQP